jgi:hypothetical protein
MRLARPVVAELAAALVLASVAPCEAAPAARPPTSVVTQRLGGAAAADGWRYVAWGGGDGQVTVLDDVAGSTSIFGLGRDCDRVYPLSGSHGFFLVNCDIQGRAGIESSQFVLDVQTGVVTALAGTGWTSIGRNWVQGTGDDGLGPFAIYLNWHTGDTITEGLPGSGEMRLPYDLDSPGLDTVAPPTARDFVAGRAGALELVGRSVRFVSWSDDTRLGSCRPECSLVSVTGAVALWSDGSATLSGYVPASGRRLHWKLPADAVVRGATARRVYYLAPRQFDPQFFRLKTFRWR